MSRAIAAIQQTASAARAGGRPERGHPGERRNSKAGAAGPAALNQDASVIGADRHPPDQPGCSQIRSSILFKAAATGGEAVSRLLRGPRVVSPSCETCSRFVVTIRRLESGKGHLPQPCDAHAGSLTDARKRPGMRTVPPSGLSGTVIDPEGLFCEHMERHAQASRQAEQPRKERLLGSGFDVERKRRSFCRSGCRSECDFNGFKLQHGDAGTAR